MSRAPVADATTPTSGGTMCAEAQGPDQHKATSAPPDMKRRPATDEASFHQQKTYSARVSEPTDSEPMPRPVVAVSIRGAQRDSDARLAGELAAARVEQLEPLAYSEKCWDCAALGIRELMLLGWDRRFGWRTAACPHLLEEAS